MSAVVLTQSQIQFFASWNGTAPNTGFKDTKANDRLSFNNYPAPATYNRVLVAQYSLAASGVQVIDLASFNDYYTGAAVVLTKAAGIVVQSNGQPFRIEPNAAANPLPWFFGIAANYLLFGASEAFGVFSAVTFTTGSKLKLTNTGGSAGTFNVAIIGGT